MISPLGDHNTGMHWERDIEMKKAYERPVLRTMQIAFGVFGSYGNDNGGGGGGGHHRGGRRGGGRWWWW